MSLMFAVEEVLFVLAGSRWDDATLSQSLDPNTYAVLLV